MAVEDRAYELSRDEAADLQDAVGDALTERREFFRTAGVHREDGTYEVVRRGADSSGNSKVFESFAALGRLFDRLPEKFSADDVGRTGITGSRRHMLVRHVAEHPDFDCTITKRNPLTVEKTGESACERSAGSDEGEVVNAD
ncbi:DUF7528 family protein [Halorussus pelagicus]|uniref:DUF7528 family protein n=1 Tax=Halorussus pelagicus TaxID=2505977 RepID=UPI0037444CD4